jgi:hypothetical protein
MPGYKWLAHNGKAGYVVSCCNVLGELIETEPKPMRVEVREVNEYIGNQDDKGKPKIEPHDVEFEVTPRANKVRCPNYHCRREFFVVDRLEHRIAAPIEVPWEVGEERDA